MIVNIPTRIHSERSGQDAPIADRPVYIESFEDGSGFVFNVQNPSGVKYLTKDTLAIYTGLMRGKGLAPSVDIHESALYADLVRHGISYAANMHLGRYHKTEIKKTFTVWFHISNACNLSCGYCYIPKLVKAVDIKEMDRHFMKSTTIEVATNSLFQFCVDNHFTHLLIRFAGGEPTLAIERIQDTCGVAKRLAALCNIQVEFAILTNGVFIDQRIFETLSKYHFAVSISMDGDKDRQNEIRFTIPRSRFGNNAAEVKREGSWDTIDRNIDILLSQGLKPFILCTVTERNYTHLLDLVKYTVSKRIGVRFSLIRDGSSHKKENLEKNILAELINMYTWLGVNMPADMSIERYARFAEWKLDTKRNLCVVLAKVQWQ